MKFVNQLNQPIVKKHFSITLLGIALGLLVYYYVISQSVADDTPVNLIANILFFSICGIVVSYGIYGVSKKLDTLVPWQTQLANRFLAGILGQAALAFVVISVFLYGYNVLFDFQANRQSVLLKLGIIVFVVILLYTIVYFAFYSYNVYSKLQIDAIAYDRKQIDLQLKALKSQLSSHFLFNNLNTISSLVDKDEKQAEDYTRGLAAIYSYTLSSYHKKWVPIREELEYVNAYLLLLKTRFGDAMSYAISIPERILTTNIPPLTLQMLVENAIKHNQIDSDNKLLIKIEAKDNAVLVRNNITNPPAHIRSFNIGLKNIASRYQLLSNKNINITKDTHFTVEIPVINT